MAKILTLLASISRNSQRFHGSFQGDLYVGVDVTILLAIGGGIETPSGKTSTVCPTTYGTHPGTAAGHERWNLSPRCAVVEEEIV
jgi:hypothetical protein